MAVYVTNPLQQDGYKKLVQKRVDGYFREPGTEFNEFESNKLGFESVIQELNQQWVVQRPLIQDRSQINPSR